MFFLLDWWGQYSIDRAGLEEGRYTPRELRALFDEGKIGPKTWLRHYWTQKYSLVGEILFANKLASEEEYEAWYPKPTKVTFTPHIL